MIAFRVAFRLLCLALCAGVSSSALADTIIVNDVFSDGTRTGQTPPSSLNWLVNTGSILTTSTTVGSLQLNNASSRLLVGYLAGAPLTIGSGQSLRLQIVFRSDVTPSTVANGFNLALFNSAGVRVAGDFSGTSNAAFANYDGYGIRTSGLGSIAGSNLALRQRNAGTSAAPMSASADWATLASGSGSTIPASANVGYVARFTVTNNGGSVALNYTLTTADGVTTLQSLSGTDSSTLVTAFDTVVLYAQTAEFPSGQLFINQIEVSVLGDAAAEAPVITAQPQSQLVGLGETATFSVTASGTAPLTYQWTRDGINIEGATNPSLILTNVQSDNAGIYSVTITNSAGSIASEAAVLTVDIVPRAPQILSGPANQAVTVGASVTFGVTASGTSPLHYVWQKNGTAIAGAINLSLTLTNVQSTDAGRYSVTVSNLAGSASSDEAILTVNVIAPAVTRHPANETVRIGESVTLAVTASGSPPLRYQWSKDGVAIGGATQPVLTLNNVQSGDSGSYTVAVSNPGGTVLSNSASVTVITGSSGTLSQYNLTGFATEGAGTTGGGIIAESDPAYVKVTTPLEFANALIAAAKTAGAVKVIEIMNDLDLGWNEIGSAVQALPSSPFRAHAAPKLHPVLLTTGLSLIDIRPRSGLTIFSAHGAAIRHSNWNIKGASNIIVRNLKFDEAWEWDEATKGDYDSNDWDFITLSNGDDATHIWIDHCTFTKSYDGILDQKAGTRFVTISWCNYVGDDGATNPNSWVRQQIARLETNRTSHPFYNFLRTNGFSIEDIVQIVQGQDKAHLLGSNSLDAGNNTLSTTFHHLRFNNMWDRCVPRLRGGNVHDYNIFVDNTDVLAAKRLRDVRAAALTPSLRNTLNSTYNFNPPINGSISTENGALLVERSAYIDCLWPLRNNQTDPSNPIYTGKIQALDTIYIFHQTDGSVTNVRGNSTDAGNPLGPFQAPVIPFAWNLPGNQLPYGYRTDDPAQLATILADGAGAGRLTWAKRNWLATNYNEAGSAVLISSVPANTTATVGDNLTFTVVASGNGPLSYQWYKDDVQIVGATSASLALTQVNIAAAGLYSVTVNDSGGSATTPGATLTINQGVAVVTLSALDAVYDGTPKAASVVTSPVGLPVTFTYAGSANLPTEAGSYAVVATVVDENYTGSAAGTLVIARASASIVFSSLLQTYDGAPKFAAVSTLPSGLEVTVTYDGNPEGPINAGSYTVSGMIADPNYLGSTAETLVIAKLTVSVELRDLAQTYDGSPKSAIATSWPPGLELRVRYDGASALPVNAGSYAVDADVIDRNHRGHASGTLVIGKALANITLAPLTKKYDGAPVSVVATTLPGGLAVELTYDGRATPPVYPGRHTVIALIDDPNYSGTVTDTLVIRTTVLVRHAPMINGLVNGSVQVAAPEGVTLNGSSTLGGDLLVRGTPRIQTNGRPTLAGTKDGPGSAVPSNYTVTLNNGAVAGYVVRRVDPVELAPVAAPPTPRGTRDVSLGGSTGNPGDFSTLRNLTLNSGAGNVAVPAGGYGAFTANGGGFILGIRGATEPSVYHLQSLTLNRSGSLQIVGPVIIIVAKGVVINSVMGNEEHPEWLVLRVAAGEVSLNSGAILRAIVTAPNSAVSVNGTATLVGEVSCDRLSVSSGGLLDEP